MPRWKYGFTYARTKLGETTLLLDLAATGCCWDTDLPQGGLTGGAFERTPGPIPGKPTLLLDLAPTISRLWGLRQAPTISRLWGRRQAPTISRLWGLRQAPTIARLWGRRQIVENIGTEEPHLSDTVCI